jgi:hypothetical protein
MVGGGWAVWGIMFSAGPVLNILNIYQVLIVEKGPLVGTSWTVIF